MQPDKYCWMTDSYNRIQEHLGIALRKLSLFDMRVAAGQDPSREAARCLADLQRVAEELDQAFDAVKRERQRVAASADDADATMRRARTLFEGLPSACLVVQRGGALIDDANAAAARLLNTSQRHLIGKPFTNFLQQDRQLFLHQLQGAGVSADQWHVTLRPRERAAVRVLVNAVVDTEGTAAIVLLPSVNAAAADDSASRFAEAGQRPSPRPS